MTARAPSRADWLALWVCVLGPACLAAMHLANVADAAHDEAVVRALGLGWTGGWRALDVPWAGLFAWLPVGTRAARAAMAGSFAAGVAGGLSFVVARALIAPEGAKEDDAKDATGKGLRLAIAAVASLAATLGPAWQAEAGVAGGSALGPLLALLPCALVLAGGARVPFAALAFTAGLACSYDPVVGLCAIASIGASLATGPGAARRALRSEGARAAGAFALGLAPLAWALVHRASGAAILSTAAGALASPVGERAASGAGYLVPLLRDDVGNASTLLAAAGVVVAALDPALRAPAASVGGVLLVGYGSLAFGAPAGPTRYAPAVLAAVGAAYTFAGVAMFAVVRAVARAPVPFARASAAMIVLLEATFPARAADDSQTRADQRNLDAARTWDSAATDALPAGAALLVADPRVSLRLGAARAEGELRADLALIPLFDLGGRVAMRELARDPKLQPVWRDATLLGQESEWSLSTIATSRPLVAPIDPRWDRALSRHFLPAGLFARFEPEPRGASDRRKALDEFAPVRDRLARAIDGDPELLAITTALLRARAIALAETSERDIVARAIDDLRPFSPRDPVALELVKRAAAKPHGSIDVTGLVP